MNSPDAAQAAALDARARLRQRSLPDLTLLDQHARPLRFYSDVVRDRQVVIQVMYTSCSRVCPPATRNLVAARELLGDLGRQLRFIAITLAPLGDTPAVLRAYQLAHGLDEGWTLLTGEPRHVETVTRALGLLGRTGDAAAKGAPQDHSGTAIVGDEARVRWGHASTLTTPRGLARMIRFELS